eukprot:1168316-Pyramimonas_sp.AAC.1
MQSRARGPSEASRERQSNIACYVRSRDPRNCQGPQDGFYRQRRGLADAEEIRRDTKRHS